MPPPMFDLRDHEIWIGGGREWATNHISRFGMVVICGQGSSVVMADLLAYHMEIHRSAIEGRVMISSYPASGAPQIRIVLVKPRTVPMLPLHGDGELQQPPIDDAPDLWLLTDGELQQPPRDDTLDLWLLTAQLPCKL